MVMDGDRDVATGTRHAARCGVDAPGRSDGALMTVHVRPIGTDDVPATAEFLHVNLNGRVSPDAWAQAMQVPWAVSQPNHGFLLAEKRSDAESVVGVYLAFYSERIIAGKAERFCNLGAWCVLPSHRFGGIRLLKALLAQPGYTFTDLSPSGAVVPLNERLNFTFLDTTTALMPNLPWPGWPGRSRIITDASVIRATLSGADLQRYLDHERAAAARHVLLVKDGRHCHVMFRRDRRKRLPLFASILYVSDTVLFHEMARPLARHLLLRHGIAATLAEARIVGGRPKLSVLVPDTRRKMFKSSNLQADQIDNLYSELVCVSW
jgi:hypothetical protein